MKRYFIMGIVLTFVACSKNHSSGPEEKHYSSLFKNAVWAGEFKYATRVYTEPFSVQFKENGTFIWSEWNGDFAGLYKIDAKDATIQMEFTLTGNTVEAKILEGAKLGQFSYGESGWEIQYVQMNNYASKSLDNTAWQGNYINQSGAIINPCNLSFSPQNKVVPYPETARWDPVPDYVRIGAGIRFSFSLSSIAYKNFAVLMPDNTLKGIEARNTAWVGFSLKPSTP